MAQIVADYYQKAFGNKLIHFKGIFENEYGKEDYYSASYRIVEVLKIYPDCGFNEGFLMNRQTPYWREKMDNIKTPEYSPEYFI